MAATDEESLRKPLYVFDLPPELLATLELKPVSSLQLSERGGHNSTAPAEKPHVNESVATGVKEPNSSCLLCGIGFPAVTEQRSHVRSDWHGYNLKQRLKSLPTINEAQFEKLLEDLDESISGSDQSELDTEDEQKDTTLSTLLKKQAKLHHESPGPEEFEPQKRSRGSGKPPLLWFASPLLPSNTSLGFYRALFAEAELQEGPHMVDVIRRKQLPPFNPRISKDESKGGPRPASMSDPHIFLCMIGGGHFAAMIVSLTPKVNKKNTGNEERQAMVIAHKTFHRYTTRRKQGGSQSANDSAKGAAHSAGASIRRYNEMALESEIRALLTEWKEMIDKSQLIFTRATGSSNRRILFGPYDGQVLRHHDPRNRGFPFSTRRATQAELMRAFVELTRVHVSQIDEEVLAAAAAQSEREAANIKAAPAPTKPTVRKATKEEESALLHTSQLQALIRRSKAPAIVTYLTSNDISADFEFQPSDTQANHHAPTPLHLAASINAPVVVLSLLTKAAANPLKTNSEGRPPFDLAGDRATRNAFRVARSELGEERWNWDAAHCPPALSKADAELREKSARIEEEKAEAERREAERRKAETEHMKREAAQETGKNRNKKSNSRALGSLEKTGAEKREEEARGMSPEMRLRLERERRARAAEERMKKLTNGTGGAGTVR